MVEGKKRHGTRKIQRTRPEKVKKVFFFFFRHRLYSTFPYRMASVAGGVYLSLFRALW